MVSSASSMDCQICDLIKRVNDSRNGHVSERMNSDTAHTLTPISCPKCDCKSERNAKANMEVAFPLKDDKKVSHSETKDISKKPIDINRGCSNDDLEALLKEARDIETPLMRLMDLADKKDFPSEVRKAADSTLKLFMLKQIEKGHGF